MGRYLCCSDKRLSRSGIRLTRSSVGGRGGNTLHIATCCLDCSVNRDARWRPQLDNSTPKFRFGFHNAEWWPITEDEQKAREVTGQNQQKKLYVPEFALALSWQNKLYHYTDVAGLFGIVEDNGVRASHVRYMNDVAEVVHGRELAIDTLRQLASKRRLGDFHPILRRTAEIIEASDLEDYFVASFSKVEDDLSQWRAYGRDQGICIGFDLSVSGGFPHFHLPFNAIYRNRDKIGLIIFLVGKYIKEFRKDLEFYNGVRQLYT
jgi:hypothetical protein